MSCLECIFYDEKRNFCTLYKVPVANPAYPPCRKRKTLSVVKLGISFYIFMLYITFLPILVAYLFKVSLTCREGGCVIVLGDNTDTILYIAIGISFLLATLTAIAIGSMLKGVNRIIGQLERRVIALEVELARLKRRQREDHGLAGSLSITRPEEGQP